jgi:hypothetical protein
MVTLGKRTGFQWYELLKNMPFFKGMKDSETFESFNTRFLIPIPDGIMFLQTD